MHDLARSSNDSVYSQLINSEKEEDSLKMEKYRCIICDYIYDPKAGDPDHGVSPGTRFEDLPADWVCPECGAPQDQFEKI